MANPLKYTPGYDFSDFSAHNPSTQQPGDRMDVEFENIQESISETIDALADVRRSDGALPNGIVTQESLAPGLLSSLPTAAQMLASLLTVDGAASGLDADLLDGHSSTYFQVQSANLDAWSAVAPASYLTITAAAASYLTITAAAASYLTITAAAASYLTITAAAAGYQPLAANLTAWAAINPSGLAYSLARAIGGI